MTVSETTTYGRSDEADVTVTNDTVSALHWYSKRLYTPLCKGLGQELCPEMSRCLTHVATSLAVFEVPAIH